MTTEQHRNNPLHGVGIKAMLEELVEQYGWEILSSQLKINTFEKFPTIKSAHKFLHKTRWACEKTEAFYLYKFKQLPIPTDEEHALAPRERCFPGDLESQLPAIITVEDREFFDDPVSGPKFRTPFDKNIGKGGSSRREHRDRPSSSAAANGSSPWGKKAAVLNENISSNEEAEEGEKSSDDKAASSNDNSPSVADKVSSANSDPWAKWRK